MKRFFPFLIPLLLFIFSFVLYLHNLSFSVYGGDVGDLVTAAFVGGVPHAPGYPLFSLLGFLLTRISFFPTPAFAVGIISAVSGSLGIVFFYLTLRKLSLSRIIAVIASLTLATTYLFWFYNEIAEVFALNTFFIILLFYLAISFYQSQKKHFLFLFSFILGLAFAHHQTIILFVLSYLLLVGIGLFRQKRKWKSYLLGLAFFVLGFSVYLYVPVASSSHPPINWDNVHDISSFLRLLLRKDYGTFQAGGFADVIPSQRFIILKSFLSTILFQLTIPVCFVSVLGLLWTIRKQRVISIAFLLAFLLAGPIFVVYAGFPLTQNFFFGVNERFFTMSAIVILYFFAFGIFVMQHLAVKFLKRPVYGIIFSVIFLLIPLQLFFYNYPKTNLSAVWIGDTLGHDMLTPLPPHAVLFMTGDTPLFNTLYMHYARGIRPDVDVVNFANIQMNPYMLQEQEKILHENPKLKDSPPELTVAVIEAVAKKRPVFSGIQVQSKTKKLVWMPYGLYYQLLPSGVGPPDEEYKKQMNKVWQKMHIPTIQGTISGSLTISEIPSIYSSAFLVTGAYLSSHYHDNENARQYYEKAIFVDPTNAKAYDVLGLYYITEVKVCPAARDNFQKAIQLNPSDELAYLLLYSTYRECMRDPNNTNMIATLFKQTFGEDILVALKKTISQKEALF